MKSQIYASDHRGYQHAIDQVKKAYATGKPHLILIQEPAPQASSKQKAAAMTIISMIARETGETDVRRMKRHMIHDMGWLDEKVEEMAPLEVGLTDLSKDELSMLIDRLKQLCAENGWMADENFA